jgi:alkylation response protein AidB-like acyl-CoA dehydrogenase
MKRTMLPGAESDAIIVHKVREVAERVLAPRAQRTDQEPGPPIENIRALAETGLLGVSVPARYGGLEVPGEGVRACMEAVAGACGTTAFVLFQHIGTCRQIARCENEALKAGLLPEMATGARFGTLAFSHLRRPGPPALRVEPDRDGFVFDGAAPWLTGWGLARDALLAGTLADGNSIWVMAPLDDTAVEASPPMRLCAASASATVSLTCRGLRVGPERLVKRSTPAQLAADTLRGALSTTPLSLGAATAAVRLVRARSGGALTETADSLEREIAEAREAVDRWSDRAEEPGYEENALRVRAWCVELGVRAAYAAVIASGGGANGLEHPAQRLYREAMLYGLTGQTRELQAATLGRLTRAAA